MNSINHSNTWVTYPARVLTGFRDFSSTNKPKKNVPMAHRAGSCPSALTLSRPFSLPSGKGGKVKYHLPPPLLLWHHDGKLLNTTQRSGLIRVWGQMQTFKRSQAVASSLAKLLEKWHPPAQWLRSCFPSLSLTPASDGVMCGEPQEISTLPRALAQPPGIYCLH